ncbi:MAG: hypothetical protein AMXMBFR64_05030 [Myxococcales bacterium]
MARRPLGAVDSYDDEAAQESTRPTFTVEVESEADFFAQTDSEDEYQRDVEAARTRRRAAAARGAVDPETPIGGDPRYVYTSVDPRLPGYEATTMGLEAKGWCRDTRDVQRAGFSGAETWRKPKELVDEDRRDRDQRFARALAKAGVGAGGQRALRQRRGGRRLHEEI